MGRIRMGLGVFVLTGLLALNGVPQDQDESQVYTENVEDSVIAEINQLIREKRWRELFQIYRARLKSNQKKLVKSPTDPKRLINFVEFLMGRFAELPREAFEAYRIEFNGPLTVEAERALKDNDLRRLEAAVEIYFFARESDVFCDRIANQYFEQGLWANSVKHWRRILKYYPDTKLDKGVVAAKLVYAATLLQSEAQVQEIKQLIKDAKITGDVVIGDAKINLTEWVQNAQPAPVSHATPRSSLPAPYLRSRYEVLMGECGVPTTEMKRGAFPMGVPLQAQGARVKLAPPFFPAYAEAGGRRFLMFQDGYQIRAADPDRISITDENAGVFWQDYSYKPAGGRVVNPGGRNPEFQLRYFGPLIGCVVDGDDVYANMLSPREVETNQGPNPNFNWFRPPLINSIRKYRIVDGNRVAGRLLVSTDRYIFDKGRRLEFVKDRFYFSYPMVIAEDKIYVGVVAEGQAEQESYVVCLDKETLDILWYTFICAARTSGNQWFQQGMDYTVYPTMVTYTNGLIYAQTNLGAVAALDPSTGLPLWIQTYNRETQMNMRRMGVGRQIDRPANPPMVYKNRLYTLPMDAKDLMILDSATGARIPTFELPPASSGGDEGTKLDWRNIHHLIGFKDDMVLLSGSQGLVGVYLGPNPIEPNKSLWSHGTPEDGRPFLYDRYVYVPVSGMSGGLRIYDCYSFKLVANLAWPEGQDWGNIVAAKDFLFVSAADRMTVWTTSKYALRQMELKTSQGPADPDLLYRYGLDLMRSYETRLEVQDLKRARDRLASFIYLAGKDPGYAEPVRDARTRLYSVYSKLGEHSMKSGRTAEAIDSFRSAKEFAYNAQTIAEVGKNLADAHLAADNPTKAIDEYVDIMKRARDAYFKRPDSNTYEPAWRYCRAQIEELSKKYGAPVSDYLETIVGQALKDVGDDVDAMMKVMETYPATKAVQSAMGRLSQVVDSIKDPQRRLELLNRIRTTYPEIFKTEFYKPLLKTLEELGDFRRLLEELRKFRSMFGADVYQPGEPPMTVKQYVDTKVRQIDPKINAMLPRLPEKLELVARLGTPQMTNTVTTATPLPVPLKPLGIEPPSFARNQELVSFGSSVEMWDLKTGKTLWTLAHPGGYLGVLYQADPNGYVQVNNVESDSPGWKAGIRPGDLILSVNGRLVRADDFYSVLTRYNPGQRIKVGVKTNNAERTVEAEIEPIAASARYRVVFSAYTRDYRLVIGWDDMAVCVDLETGKVRWTFDDVRESGGIVAAHAMEGRILLLEGERGAAKHPYRANIGVSPAPTARLIVLGDASGDIVCIQTLSGEARGGMIQEARFYGEPFSDGAFLFLRSGQASILRLSPSGDIVKSHLLPLARLWGESYDPETSTFYYGYQDDPTGEKWLKAYRPDKELWSLNIRDLSMLDGMKMLVEANDQYVAVVLSSQMQSQISIVTSKGQASGKSLSLPDSSVIESVTLNRSLLFLYAAEVPRQGGTSRNRGAYLVCYNLTGVAGDQLWKTRAAFTTPSPNAPKMVEVVVDQDLVIVTQSQAYSENDKGYGPVVGIYSRKREGKLIFEMLGYEKGTQFNYMPTVHRGRLFQLERTGNGQGVVLGAAEK